jgi:lysophospholipase L1-like esterase
MTITIVVPEREGGSSTEIASAVEAAEAAQAAAEVAQAAAEAAQAATEAADFTVGTVATSNPGTDAVVDISGSAPDFVIDFTIPRGAGVPSGGTAGQYHRKSSGTDYATAWSSITITDVTSLSSSLSTLTSADTSINTRVSTETVTRTSADTSLTTRLSTEEGSRASADTSLTTRLSTEEVARASVDVSLAQVASPLRNVAVNPALDSRGEATSWALSAGTTPSYQAPANSDLTDLGIVRMVDLSTGAPYTFVYKNETLTAADALKYVYVSVLIYSADGTSWPSGIDAIPYTTTAQSLTGGTSDYVQVTTNIRRYWRAGQLPSGTLTRMAVGRANVAYTAQMGGFTFVLSDSAIVDAAVQQADFYREVNTDYNQREDHYTLEDLEETVSAQAATIAGMRLAISGKFQRSLAIIGDSRGQDGVQWWKNGSSTNWNGLPIGSAFVGPLATEAGNGTLEYRASDGYMRWAASSDTAGSWTPIVAGWNHLESGSADKWIKLPVKNLTGMPGTDQSVTVLQSGTVQYAWRSYGYWVRALHQMRWLNEEPAMCAIGGATSSEVIEQLPYIATQATGPGWDIILLGTNDISGSIASATIIANLTTIYDTRAGLGRKLVIVGEHARWGTASGTPMSAGQITIFDAVRAAQQAYAVAGGHIFIDAYALTYDSGYSDRRPASGMLRDHVHLTEYGAQLIGEAICEALQYEVGLGDVVSAGDADNALGSFPAGSAGSLGTGASGAAPTNFSLSRASGSTATVVASVEARDDGVSGNIFRMQCAAGASAGIIQLEGTSASSTLAALGLAVGDEIYVEVFLDIRDATLLQDVEVFVSFTGATGTPTLRTNIARTGAALADEVAVHRSPTVAIPASTTHVRPYIWVRLPAGSNADIRCILKIVKVS